MNERINKLKEQAKEKVISHGAYGETEIYWETNVDKFAELIVRECLFIIDDERKPDMVNRTELWHQIVEHFGVE